MTHLLANLRTYAAAVVLIGGAILATDLTSGWVATDLTVAVAVAGAIAVPPPRSAKVTDTTGPRQG